MKKNWKKVLVGTLCLVGFLLLLVKGNQFEKVSLISTEGQSYEKAVVTKITKDNLAEDGNRYGTQEVRVQVKSGAYAGEEFDAVNPSGSLFGMENCEVGSRVIVIVSSTDDNAVVTVYSKDRTMAIYLFVLFFCLVICIIGGKKGVKAIASLAFTGVCIVYLMFPLMYRGISPIGITIVVVILSTLLTLWLLGGVSKKTVSAVVGTVSGVVVAAVAAVVFGKAAGITGYNVSDIETLNFAYVGGSLSTLVVNYAYNLSYNQLINSYVIGTEIMQGLSGTLGVVLTVPIAAAVAAVLIGKKKIVKEPLMQDIYDGSDDYEEPETDGEYGEDV